MTNRFARRLGGERGGALIPIGAGNASATQVTVNYPFRFMVLQPVASLTVSGMTLGTPITMSASADIRNESPF
jgi:hypothetical protein